MAEEIILRQCLETDIESVLELWRAAGSTPSMTDTHEDLRTAINSTASSVLLAVSGGTVAGSIIGAFDGWRGNVYRLAVHPDHQRRGIARRLVSEVEEWLRRQGAKRVGAVVEKDHPWATGFWDSTEFVLEPMDLRYVRNL
ncbi:MAG: GNAT family N-acetyltransferase [Dehalococcoidia bacterium]